jgi:hypothetical protein
MATTKSTALTASRAGGPRKVARQVLSVQESYAVTVAELDASDVIILNLPIPSSAVIRAIKVYNDDLDADATPTLAVDIGLAAAQKFDSVTSGTKTTNLQDAVLDADAYVDGSTVLQAATTSPAVQAFDSATFGPDDADKECWEVLGYDKDPGTVFNICLTMAAGAATAAAGDVQVTVDYVN